VISAKRLIYQTKCTTVHSKGENPSSRAPDVGAHKSSMTNDFQDKKMHSTFHRKALTSFGAAGAAAGPEAPDFAAFAVRKAQSRAAAIVGWKWVSKQPARQKLDQLLEWTLPVVA